MNKQEITQEMIGDIDLNSTASTEHYQESLDAHKKEAELKIESLKDLLRKAKFTIDKQKSDITSKNQIIEELNHKHSELEAVFQKYLHEDKKSIEASQVLKVLSRVDVEGILWVCLKCTHSIEWIRETEFLNLPGNLMDAHMLPQAVNLPEFIKIKQDNELLEKQSKLDVSNVINQYEERMKRLSRENEILQKKLNETSANLSSTSQHYEQRITDISDKINKIIDESQEIRESSLGYMAEENEENIRKECMSKVKVMLMKMQKQVAAEEEGDALTLFKEHIVLLHSTLFETLKKWQGALSESSQNNKTNEEKLKALQKLKDAEKTEKEEILSQGRKMIKEQQKTLENVKLESQKLIKERDIRIEFLQQEMKKNVNIQYIKNILIKFFISDQSVKERTLPVIQTVLQFSQEESDSMKNAWLQDQHTVKNTMLNLGKIFSF